MFGAGAIGGVVGGRLFQAGHDVVLIARGPHLERLQRDGLRLESPLGSDTLPIPAVGRADEIDWRTDDVVHLAVKSQHTATVLDDLVAVAPHVPIVCLQNGVTNEPVALRLFANVQAVNVNLPATHVEPGVVQAWSGPISGLLDIGRYPATTDDVSDAVSAAFRSATFDSSPRRDIKRWKYRKLVTNLANAVEAACGAPARFGPLAKRVTTDGEAVLAAAGIDVATRDDDRERRGDLLQMGEINGRRHSGGSSWQSLQRGTGDIETDYLNGEIVLLGRLHGVPTPANALVQRVAHDLARGHTGPGTLTEAELLRQLGAAD
jgi:2-dehydropantoate 2-reductase